VQGVVVLAGFVSISAISLVTWAFWARALHSDRWGSPITTVIGLDGITLAMLGPHSGVIDGAVRRTIGLSGLTDLLGRTAFLLASVIFLVAVLSRLGTDKIAREKIHQLIELPAIIVIPLLISLYLTAHVGVPHGPLTFITQEWWVRIESIAWALAILAMQLCIWPGLRVLSHHPRHRRSAGTSLIICAGVIAALSVSIILTAIPWHQEIVGQLAWGSASFAVAVFVVSTTRRVRAHLREPEGRRSAERDSWSLKSD
jgi:hypothetical protein